MDDRLPYQLRYSQGRVKHIYTNYIDVELTPPLPSLGEVRIQREHWLPDAKRLAEGDPVPALFIYDTGGGIRPGFEYKGPGRAFASMVWGQPAHNPWNSAHPNHPAVGQVVEGDVYQRAGDRYVVVRIGEHLLEGFLNLLQVPHGRTGTTEQLLQLGMRLQAVITQVDVGRCALELSVVQHLQALEDQRGRGPHLIGQEHSATPYLRFIEAGDATLAQHPTRSNGALGDASNASRWSGVRVLLIDNDKVYSKAARAWIEQFGAAFMFADNVVHAKAVLADGANPPTHVLVDYHFGSSRDSNGLVRMLARYRKDLHIALISGAPGPDVMAGAAELRRRFNFAVLGLFAKPLRFGLLDAWLLKGITPADPHPTVPADHWGHDGGEISPDLVQRAARWLQAIMSITSAGGALWVKCHQPGYNVVASVGLLQDEAAPGRAASWAALEQDMAHSIVADVEATHQARDRNRAVSDPLNSVFPRNASHCLALPLWETSATTEADSDVADVLLIFTGTPLSAAELYKRNTWPALWQWWKDLMELGRLQDRLQEDAVFATQGRVHMATLHELRPALQVFQSDKVWTAEVAQAWWRQGKTVTALVEGGLYAIRPERVQEVSLRERLYAVMDQFLWAFAQRRFVTLVLHLPPAGLRVVLAPEVFEQPLINLVDNATKACAQRRWAQVHVHIRVDPTSASMPLVLSVSDDGVGMTPQEARHLYQPRHSQLGTTGFGMGLFISQRLARAAGGELKLVKNIRWVGSTFELRLPLQMGLASVAANQRAKS